MYQCIDLGSMCPDTAVLWFDYDWLVLPGATWQSLDRGTTLLLD